MPDFYNFQNKEIKKIIAGIFEKYTDLGNTNTNTPETTLFYEFRRICSDHNEHEDNFN